MDIDEDRLKLVYLFAKRYASEIHADVEFHANTDRIEAIRDSDFVINSAILRGIDIMK